MRSILIPVLFAASLLPAAAFAQTGPQTAAADAATAAGSGITREQYMQRAQERAGRRAGARFDQMDANHDGVLDRAEMRAWRSQHPRRARVQSDQPSQQ
jgi:hypothetical protein